MTTELLCFFPTDDTTCTSHHGALTDDAWATLCEITLQSEVTEIVPTLFE